MLHLSTAILTMMFHLKKIRWTLCVYAVKLHLIMAAWQKCQIWYSFVFLVCYANSALAKWKCINSRMCKHREMC